MSEACLGERDVSSSATVVAFSSEDLTDTEHR